MREWILLGFVLLSIPFVLKRPLLGIIIYLGATIVRPEMLFWGSKAGSYVFMVYYIAIVVGIFLHDGFGKIGQAMKRETLLLAWLLGAIFLSVVLAQYPIFRGYYYVFELLKGFGICVLLYLLVNTLEDYRTIQNVLLGCFAFLAVWGIDQHFRGNERLEGLGGSAWGDSNGVAAMFILFLPVAIARAFASENRRQYWLFMGIAALMAALIVCTQSRSGLIGLIVSLVMFGFYSRKSLKVVQTIAVLGIVALPFATQQYISRMNTMAGGEEFQSSAQDRITLWKSGLLIFADNPLVGTGFLTFPEAKMKYEDQFLYLDDEFRESIFRTDNKKVVHNTYIQLLSDCGLIGAIPFMLLLGGGITLGLKARRMLRDSLEYSDELLWISGLSAGMAGFAVCIFSIDAAMEIGLYVQIVLATILYRIIMDKAAEQKSDLFAPGNRLRAAV
jgi:O-antigen ligase